MKPALTLTLALAAVAAAGCGRAHLSKDYGRAYHEQFALQRDHPGVRPATTGLDAQEASILAQSYRRGLAPREADEKAQPVLVVAPAQAGSGRAALPPPSVPRE